jgi:hypothetical protein
MARGSKETRTVDEQNTRKATSQNRETTMTVPIVLTVTTVFDVKSRGVCAGFVDRAHDTGDHERLSVGTVLRRGDGAMWTVGGIESGLTRSGAYLLKGETRPVVGDRLEFITKPTKAGELCPKCMAPVKAVPGTGYFRGAHFAMLVCYNCHCCWDNSEDSLIAASVAAGKKEREET